MTTHSDLIVAGPAPSGITLGNDDPPRSLHPADRSYPEEAGPDQRNLPASLQKEITP